MSVLLSISDKNSIEKVSINLQSVNTRIKEIFESKSINSETNRANWLLKAVSVIDLTTLAGDDTESNVKRLCYKAVNPFPVNYYDKITKNHLTTAAVCVYPTKVATAAQVITSLNASDRVQIAAVATGFPTGLYALETRLSEIKFAIENGATEIDVVIDRSLVLSGQWDLLYQELVQMREACAGVHLKVILGIGELGTMTNVYKASLTAMQAGCDFIKTSTGKEGVNATLAVGLVMCRAIRQFHDETGTKIGLKPAGGIRTSQDAVNWLILIKEELGDDWLNSKLFRIGASGLLGDIENWFCQYTTKQVGSASKFSFI
ncbi:deoxyribose-phosphate aldolase isoform X2 [Arctopsyche grandis]|uniref:deoxyribose-phosphate aldolase isoform X2 n=1 Tax=Arctopsyche grandis TaxID=121162 RepID=UPI00406D94E2